jgi:MscS family membrane protein
VSLRFLLVAFCWLLLAARTGAQDTARTDNTADISVDVSDASPRAMVEHFLALARAGNFDAAVSYLDLPDSLRGKASATARQLKAVLDRYLWVDLERLSPHAAGDTADGLPAGMDHVGTIQASGHPPLRVRAVRAPAGDVVSWRFARGTLDQIPAVYEGLEDRWILEHLPDALLRPGPFDILRWQWLAFPFLIAAAVLVGSLASRLTSGVLRRLTRRTNTALDDAIVERLYAPTSAALALFVARLLVPLLNLYPPAADATYRILRVGFFVVVFWSLWRLIDVARRVLAGSQWAITAGSSRSLIPLGSRVAKVVVFAIAAVAVLSLLGYPVASLVAGLGLGGLAFALAAQKTVENLFGAFSIGVDQPFREGDFVRVEDFVGTVESIGLRSTRFRTLDRTLITIPNGRLADMRLESFTVRDRMRLAAVIGLVYETTEEQMREVLTGFERVLREHPQIWPDAVVVRFREFAASSLDIEIMAWFQTREWSEFQLIRQGILLDFMGVVERAGTSFAFPTQTIHLAGGPLRALADNVVSESGQYRSQ